jgi:hypothetical protein
MPLAGPFTFLDYGATPTMVDGVEVYPPQAGLFYITDLDTFAAMSETLTPWRVFPAPTQAVLAGDDPADPQHTVTLCFPDAPTATPIVETVDALPPIPTAPPPPPPPPPPPEPEVLNYRFMIALRGFPSLTGDPSRTLRDDWDAAVGAASPEVQDRAKAPSFYRSDEMLNAQFNAAVGDVAAAQALLSAVFDAAVLVP